MQCCEQLHSLFTLCPCVQAVGAELQDRAEVLRQLEADSQSLAQFVSSGESARIKARLTQIGRYWEELKESVQQLDGQLEESSSNQQKFKMNLEEVNDLTDMCNVWCSDVKFTVLRMCPRYKRLSVSCMRNWNIPLNPAPLHQKPTKLFKTTRYSVVST